jgi:hypothetical protein
MKNNLLKYYITAFYLCSTFAMFAQDPGIGGGIENDGTGDTTPAAPIDDYVLLLAILGLILVFVRFKSIQSKKIKIAVRS